MRALRRWSYLSLRLVALIPTLALIYATASCVVPAQSLPDLDQSSLADAVELHQARVESLCVTCTALSGYATEDQLDDIRRGKTTFDSGNPLEVFYSYGVDYVDGKKDLLFRMMTDEGETHTRAVAFDGKQWTKELQKGLHPDRWYGEVTVEEPSLFTRDMLLSPREIEYDVVKECGLAALIRNAEDTKIELGSFEGESCYVTTLIHPLNLEVIIRGQPVLGTRYLYVKLFLSPEHGMLPIKVEFFNPKLPTDPRKNPPFSFSDVYVSKDTPPSKVIMQLDVREVRPGIWMPYRIFAYSSPRPNSEDRYRFALATVESVRVNEPGSVKGRVAFHSGTRVSDEIRGLEYVVGFSPGETRELIESAVDAIKDAQAGHVSLDIVAPSLSALSRQAGAEEQETSETLDARLVSEPERVSQNWPRILGACGAGVFLLSALVWVVARRRKR